MDTARTLNPDPDQPGNESLLEMTTEAADNVENSAFDGQPVEPGPSEPPEKTGTDQRFSQLAQIQHDLYRILRFAVSQTNLTVDKALINSTVSVLHKSPKTFTREEEELLWENFNTLSTLIAPATNESIRIAELIDEDQRSRTQLGMAAKRAPAVLECCKQLRRVMLCLLGVLLLFIVLQSYVILLTDVLRSIEQNNNDLDTVSQQIHDIKTVKPDLVDEDPNLQEQIQKRTNLDAKVNANYDMLIRLSAPWHWLYTGSQDPEALSLNQELSHKIAVEQAAKSILQVLNYYLLPLILGLLGAVAFIVRSLLRSLSTTSYTLNSGRRHAMRLALGALLGVISGIFLAPEQTDLQPFKLSLVVLAFLMGYSVEFAFSIFDALIERGRKAVIASDTQPGAQAKNDK